MDRGDEIRVALIGYGLGGAAFHAPLIAATPGMRLSFIVTSNAERARQAAERYPTATIVPSADDLWARAGEIDLVAISTPNVTHVPLAMAALAAGHAVVIDKPFAASAEEGRTLADQAARRGLLLSVFQNRRWDGDFLTIRRLIREGALGNVHRFESRFERWRPVPKEGWREHGDPAEAGGLLYDLGSHLIDQALVLFGPATHVYAEVDRRRPGVSVDDDAFVALTHASGVRSHLWMSHVDGDDNGRFRVLGSKAAYVKEGLDLQESVLRGTVTGLALGEEPRERWGRIGAGDAWQPVPTERGAYTDYYAGIARALRDGTPPPVDPADAIAGLEIIAAARRSAATRQVLPLG